MLNYLTIYLTSLIGSNQFMKSLSSLSILYILFQSGQKVRILMLIKLSEKDAALRRKSLTKG
jgi:hypothetical protein